MVISPGRSPGDLMKICFLGHGGGLAGGSPPSPFLFLLRLGFPFDLEVEGFWEVS